MFWIIIGSALGGILIGTGLTLWRIQPRLRIVELGNKELEDVNISLKFQHEELLRDIKDCRQEADYLKNETAALSIKRDELFHSISDLKLQADEAGKMFYEQAMETMQVQLEQSAEKERIKYQQAEEEYRNEYAELLAQCVAEFHTACQSMELEQDRLQRSLDDQRSITKSAIEANRRANEIAEQANFYKLNIPEADLEEIEKLRSIIPYLRDPEALNKVIWKVYYEKPYTDLIGRVVNGNKTGIYKITNQNNQMCYVGQAVNIADRWKQHIKRGVGAETPTKNKLYPAMLKEGVENFTFEIVEECDRTLLNEKEDYWQDYFEAKAFGYSIK